MALALLVGCAQPTATPTAPAPSPSSKPVPVLLNPPSPAPGVPSPSASPSPSPAASPAIIPSPSAIPPTPVPTAEPAFNAARVSLSVQRVGAGFTHPLYITHAGDGSGRVFVAEKVGRLRQLDGTPFLDITDRVLSPDMGSNDREQGFAGVAFHPRFRENGFVFVYYITRQNHTVVSRFTARGNGPIDRATEKIIFTTPQFESTFKGGMLVFGRDGYLYIGLGTGGQARQYQFLAQDLNSPMGKILRIDVDRGDPYAIPSDNPFVGRPNTRGEIWAYGLRNPYRFTFDRVTNDLYIGGPGQFRKESIYFTEGGNASGKNFGWPTLEGSVCWEGTTCNRAGLPLPDIEYDTYANAGCVVVSGHVYRGQAYPLLRGAFLYGDFCNGRISVASRGANGTFTSTYMTQVGGFISSFGEDEAGEAYVTDMVNGFIHRIVATAR
jgi:glucose/arabinose dehydrogenase